MAKVKVDLGVAEVIGKVKDTETINQADKTTALPVTPKPPPNIMTYPLSSFIFNTS